MTYTKTTSTSRTTLSRIGVRGLLIFTGVMALLISSLSGSASLNTAVVAPFKPASADLSQVEMAAWVAIKQCRTLAMIPLIGSTATPALQTHTTAKDNRFRTGWLCKTLLSAITRSSSSGT